MSAISNYDRSQTTLEAFQNLDSSQMKFISNALLLRSVENSSFSDDVHIHVLPCSHIH